jgi:hypothetical protein
LDASKCSCLSGDAPSKKAHVKLADFGMSRAGTNMGVSSGNMNGT